MAIHYVELTTLAVDGAAFTADDIIVIRSGARAGLLLQNFNGNGRYITITNEKTTPSTKVIINGKSSFGCLTISNCKYIDLRGDNDVNFEYGIKVINDDTCRRTGSVWIHGESDHIKLSHFEITCEGNITFLGYGIFISDPILTASWIYNNFEIHHNYIHDTRSSGMGFGYSNPLYNNKPYMGTFLIHDNLLEDLGMHGIYFIGVKGDNNYIYNNIIRNTGVVRTDVGDVHKSGLRIEMFETGYMCEVYNNRIENTVGTGIKCNGDNHLIHDNTLCGCGSGNDIDWGHGIRLHDLSPSDEPKYRYTRNVKVNDNIIIQAKRYGIYAVDVNVSASASRNLIGDCGSGSIIGTNIYEGTGTDANIYHDDVKDFGFKRWTDDGDCSNDDFSLPGDLCYGKVCPNVCVGTSLWSQKCNPLTGECVTDTLIEANSSQCDYDPCEGKVCPDVCVGTDLWSQKCNPLTGECVTDTLIEANSSQCDYDPCEGKVCPDVCVGTNLWSQKCNPLTGECVTDTLIEANSSQCDYDLCEGKVCPDVCVGTDLWSQKCNPLTGECVTDTLIESNSLQCDYKPGIENLEEIPQSEFNIVYVDSEHITSPNIQLPAINMIDGDPATYWRTESWTGEPPHPHEVQIDLGQIYGVSGFRYLPRQDVSESGMIKDYEFYVSNDIVDWGQPVSIGTFPLNRNEQEVLFSEKQGRYIRLVALSEFRPDGKVTSVAELNVLVSVYTDLCEGKVCPDVCVETDLWSLKCDPLIGNCIPDKLIQVDSPSCIIPDEIPTDDSPNMTYIILGGLGLSGLALLLLSMKK